MLDFFERYDHLIIPEPNSGCHIWLGELWGGGYGRVTCDDGKTRSTHRLAYEAVHGIGSLTGLLCRHSCDMKPCCNTDHLLPGDHSDNANDAVRRGRIKFARGEDASSTYISEDEAIGIRAMAMDGFTSIDILTNYPNVSRQVIGRILRGDAWQHLGPPVKLTRIKGSQHPLRKLTSDQINEIIRRLEKGEMSMRLAEEFGVSNATMSRIKNRVTI